MHDIKIPLMKTAANEFLSVITGVKNKTMDREDGHLIVRACNGLRGTLETDLKIRLAAPRLEEIETPKAPQLAAA